MSFDDIFRLRNHQNSLAGMYLKFIRDDERESTASEPVLLPERTLPSVSAHKSDSP